MLDEIMPETDVAPQNPATPEELSITKLFYLELRKSIVDNDTEKLYTELKDIILPSYGDITAAKSNQSKEALEKIIKKIDKDREVREGYESRAEESEEEVREKGKETQARIKETLKLYAEYFKIKFEGIGLLDDDFNKYIQNLTFSNEEFKEKVFPVNGNGLLSSILDPKGQIQNFLELEQVLEKYLLGLTIKTELQINLSEKSGLGQEYNASEIKNILAVFPGSYEIKNQKVVTDVEFACIPGTAERV
jgi:hypothetical protein